MPLVLKANADSVGSESPERFDQSVIEFAGPFRLQKTANFFAACNELATNSPNRVFRVRQGDFLADARVSGMFRCANLLGCRLKREWWRNDGLLRSNS